MRFTIQWRFITKFVLLIAVLAIAVHFTHRWQVKRQVGIFLTQADRAHAAATTADEQGNTKLAADEREREQTYLERYLLARPDDLDLRDRLARLLIQNAKSSKQLLNAFLVLEDVLRRDPARDDLRRYTIDVALTMQFYKEALGHAEFLNDAHPNDGELEGLVARCLSLVTEKQLVLNNQAKANPAKVAETASPGETSGQVTPTPAKATVQLDEEKQYQRAAELYGKSVEHRPDLLSSYTGQAYLLRTRLRKESEANAVIDSMTSKNDKNYRAFVLASKYWRELKQTDKAEKAMETAIALAPDEVETQLAAAESARARARQLLRINKDWRAAAAALQDAIDYLTRARDLHPKDPGVYTALASLEADIHGLPEAIAVIRQGLAALPQSSDLTIGLMEYQFRSGDAAGASETVEVLQHAGLAQHLVDYEHARVLILKEEWLEASHILSEVLPRLPENSYILHEANILLGRCYEQLGEKEQRLNAFTRAVPIEVTDPLWVPAMLGLADSYAALGLSAEALRTYRKLNDWVPAAIVPVARLEMLKAVQSAQEKPDWTASEAAITQAEKLIAEKRLPETLEVRFLRARLLSLQGKNDEARKRFDALVKEQPQDPTVWVELAFQDLREGNAGKALDTLAAGEKATGDTAELRMARAQMLVASREQELPAKLAALAAGIDKFPLAQRRQLLRTLTEMTNSLAGADAISAGLWESLARLKPFDLSVHLLRFDYGSRVGNKEVMEEALKKITEIDGVDGQTARLSQALYLIQQSRNDKKPESRAAALNLLTALDRERIAPPRSGKVSMGLALIHDMNGNVDAALENYQKAVSRGEPNPQALRRQMELLSSKRMYSEAMAVFEKLPPATAASRETQRLAAEVSLQIDHTQQAMDLAAHAVSQDSTNYKDQLWLGRMTWSAGDRQKPEKLFRRAVELAPDAMDARLALMQYFIVTDRKDDARKELEAARSKVKKADLNSFLAIAYSQLGDAEKAVEFYKQARIEKPNDAQVLLAEAEYLIAIGRLNEARDGFRRVIDLYSVPPAEKSFARQRLALAMAADPDYATSRSALELLSAENGNSASLTETPAQRRARAVVYALQKERESKLEAIRLLEENPDGRTPNELFLLARLHLAVGNQKNVRLVMSELLKTPKNHIPLYTSFFAMWLLRQDDVREAEVWVNETAKAAPDSLQTAELKARLAAAKKDLTSARSTLLPQADKGGPQSVVVARICEDIGLFNESEQLISKYVDDNKSKDPKAELLLVSYYGRRGRTADALKKWEEIRGKLPKPQVAEAMVRVLYTAKTQEPADQQKVAEWLETAATQSQGQDKSLLLQLLATLRNLQGDYARSEALYREVIAANPRDALAMNNLAYMLSARQGRHDDAIALLQQARKIIGPHPVLMQTEAQVRLNMQDPQAALKLIEVAVVESPTASGYYTLARAQAALKKDFEARSAWRKAKELGLQASDLHPLEREGFQKFSEQMK